MAISLKALFAKGSKAQTYPNTNRGVIILNPHTDIIEEPCQMYYGLDGETGYIPTRLYIQKLYPCAEILAAYTLLPTVKQNEMILPSFYSRDNQKRTMNAILTNAILTGNVVK